MRIISSFYDYYDKGLAFGADPNLVYIRESQEKFIVFGDKKQKDNKLLEMLDSMPRITSYHGIIAFCGKAFPYYNIPISFQNYKTYYSVKSLKEDIENSKLTNNDTIINVNSL